MQPIPKTVKGGIEMKRKLLCAGEYLLAGIVSCAVLAAVSISMCNESPLPVTAQSADAMALVVNAEMQGR